MEPKRTLHSGNLVRGFHVGDRKLFIMELGTCFDSLKGQMGGRKMNIEISI